MASYCICHGTSGETNRRQVQSEKVSCFFMWCKKELWIPSSKDTVEIKAVCRTKGRLGKFVEQKSTEGT